MRINLGTTDSAITVTGDQQELRHFAEVLLIAAEEGDSEGGLLTEDAYVPIYVTREATIA